MSKLELTPPQKLAATHIDHSVGIVANAGSGKTRVLVERVLHILESGTADLHNILLVTFTEKAAQELRERLSKRLSIEKRLDLLGASITTFHGFAMRILQEHAPAAKLPSSFRVASEGEAASLLHHAIESSILEGLDGNNDAIIGLCKRFKFRSIVKHMAPLLEDRWSFEQNTESDTTITPLFERCAEKYKTLKIKQSLLDFHDLEIELWKLFNDDPKILSDYQRQFRHIMVDEFQDTNPLQTAIVQQLFTPPDNTLCIVGDPKQSIYRFRRADVRCFSDMLTRIIDAGGETIVLPDNFRSTPGIIHFTNTVCKEMPNYTPLIAHRGESDKPSLVPLIIQCETTPTAEERRLLEVQTIIQNLPKLIQDHDGPSNIACLFQTRATLQLWADALRASGFPIHIYSSGGFWERPEIQTLITALHVITGIHNKHPDERHLLAMLISPLFSITLDDVYRWRHMMPQSDDPHESAPLHSAVIRHSAVGQWLNTLHDAIDTQTPYEVLKHIVQSTHYLETLNSTDPTGQQAANVESLLRRVQRISQIHAVTMPNLLEQLVELRDRGERVPDSPAAPVHDNAIQLMTIHAAKGNEFSAVILADCKYEPRREPPAWLFEPGLGFAIKYTDDLDPNHTPTDSWEALATQYRSDEASERSRLLYVALTRAENQLIIPIHPNQSGKESPLPPRNWHDALVPYISMHKVAS